MDGQIFVLGFFVLIFLLCALCYAISGLTVFQEYERGVLFRWGKMVGVVNPGIHFITPIVKWVARVDMRVQTIDIPSQKAMTKDNVPVTVDACVYAQVVDPVKATIKVNDWRNAMVRAGQGALRNVIGTCELDFILSDTEKVIVRIEEAMRHLTTEWGVKLITMEVHDIMIPDTMKRILARQAEAEREKRALQLDAQGELLASEDLAKAAERLAEVPGGLHLRTLLTLYDIAAEPANKMVILLPAEIMKAFEGFLGDGREEGPKAIVTPVKEKI